MGGVSGQRAVVFIYAFADGAFGAGGLSDDRWDDRFLPLLPWRQNHHRTDATPAKLDAQPDLQRRAGGVQQRLR
ncbi:hypothetical protein D3C85_1462820 [compost metagenome]